MLRGICTQRTDHRDPYTFHSRALGAPPFSQDTRNIESIKQMRSHQLCILLPQYTSVRRNWHGSAQRQQHVNVVVGMKTKVMQFLVGDNIPRPRNSVTPSHYGWTVVLLQRGGGRSSKS